MNSFEDGIALLASRTKANKTRNSQMNRQRRTLVQDDFDKEYSCVGNADAAGQIWLAISPDMEYMERWEIKIIVEPFTVPLASGSKALSPATLTIDPIDLSISETKLTGAKNTWDNGVKITPENHKHEITPSHIQPTIKPNPHSHSVNAGVTLHPSAFTTMSVTLDGIDLTPMFKAQQGGQWITSASGMYPDTTLGNRYNIFQALDTLGQEKASPLLEQGYHLLEFKADGLFSLKVREFKKYSFTNRHGGGIDD